VLPAAKPVAQFLPPMSQSSLKFQKYRPLLQHFLAHGILLCVHLRASFLQCVFIFFDFLCCSGLGGFRSLSRAQRARIALCHYPEQRVEKQRPHYREKQQNNQAHRHSPEEEFADLVNQFCH
jgi:hypothetical protein